MYLLVYYCVYNNVANIQIIIEKIIPTYLFF